MSKSATLRHIRATFNRVSRALQSDHNHDRWLDMHVKEEREHRRHFQGRTWGLTVDQAMMLVSTQQVLGLRSGHKKMPGIEDFFSLRPSFLGAAALYAQYQAAIDIAFTAEEARAFAELSYTDLIGD